MNKNDEKLNNIDNKKPNLEKPYPVRNFVKEIKRVSWPTKKKNNIYFIYVLLLIVFLVIFFALVSLGATQIIKSIGAK